MKRKNGLFVLGMAAFALALVLAGCSSAPKSFVKGSTGDTTILLRQGVEPDQAFREAIFIIGRHGFDPEMLNTEAGYIRTRWINTWNDKGVTDEEYRVRIVCNFNPTRTQLVLKAEAEIKDGEKWVSGYDTRAIATLRNDFSQSIGN